MTPPLLRRGVRCRDRVLGAFTLLSVAVSAAQASADAMPTTRAAANERYTAECGTCHIAYPPGRLPAASWRQLMSGLDRHFGSDASLDPVVARDITAYLERSAGPPDRLGANPAMPRITATRWFLREHDEIAPATFQRPAIGSAANCAACHAGAGRGDFREHDTHIPR